MRVPVAQRQAYKLLNHGPTTLVSTAAGGRRNVMAAAWVMPLDYDPPKLVAVIDGGTWTRELFEASGECVVQVPTAAQADLVFTVGSRSGRDLDKFEAFGIATSPATKVGAPLVEGCAAWLECRAVREHSIPSIDLFTLEVLAAWADDALFDGREWRFPSDGVRTIHHLSKGLFFAIGERVQAKELAPR